MKTSEIFWKNKRGNLQMQKIKNFVKRFVKKDGFLYKVIRKIYHILSTAKYKLINHKKIKEERKHFSEQANIAVRIINKYMLFFIKKLKRYKLKDQQ